MSALCSEAQAGTGEGREPENMSLKIRKMYR